MSRRPAAETPRLDDAARAGWLYYIAGNTQDEIARKLGISRPSAQRLVALAVSERLVKVRLDHVIARCMDLAEALKARYGLAGSRRADYTGVWLGGEKVCAIGVRVDHWVTAHGFALNVAADLSHFDLIVPCGIRSHGVTSIERASGTRPELAEVARDAQQALATTFGWRMETGDARGLPSPGATPERVLGGVRRWHPDSGE